MAIRSCATKDTETFLAGQRVRRFDSFARAATKKLTILQAVSRLVELRNPPSNRFEALSGDRDGQYSIRINDQWRVCFRWAITEDGDGKDALLLRGEPYDVEITDYH